MTAEKRLAFDTTRYDGHEGRIIADVASIVTTEFSTSKVRVFPLEYEVTPEGKLISCGYDDEDGNKTDIETFLSWETRVDSMESLATLEIKYKILTSDMPFYFCWLSSPDPNAGIPGSDNAYKEGRMLIGSLNLQDNQRKVKAYGIAMSDMPLTSFQTVYAHLTQLSGINYPPAKTPGEIRLNPIFVENQTQNMVDFFEEFIPLSKVVWDAIKQGEPEKLKAKAIKDAEVAKAKAASETNTKGLIYGARIESEMIKMGWQLNVAADNCGGFLNLNVLGSNLNPVVKSAAGKEFSNLKKSWDYHTGDCCVCKKTETLVGPCNICTECEKKF